MLWEGHATVRGSLLLHSAQQWLGPPAMPMARDSSHGLAFNPFCLGNLLDPCKMGAMRTRGWKGWSPWFWGTPRRGYMMLHWVAPQQSLMSARPVLATVGLLGGGSAFFSAREPAGMEKQREREKGKEKISLTTGSPTQTQPMTRP